MHLQRKQGPSVEDAAIVGHGQGEASHLARAMAKEKPAYNASMVVAPVSAEVGVSRQ